VTVTVVAGGGGGGLFGAVYDNPQPVMTSTAPSAVANKRRHLILSKRIFHLGQKFVNAQNGGAYVVFHANPSTNVPAVRDDGRDSLKLSLVAMHRTSIPLQLIFN
jgi:hypothetical protein